MAEINVTPLVDVMLVLLIVFMVTAPLLTAGVPVELPDSRAGALPQETQEVSVTLASDGVIYLDNQPLAPGELPGRLEQIVSNSTGNPPNITLRADRLMSYGQVMGIMGELNRAGLNSIALVTNSSAAPPAVITPMPDTPGSASAEVSAGSGEGA